MNVLLVYPRFPDTFWSFTCDICGPGEAKGELRSRIEQGPLSGRITAVEPADTMTDSQIAARIVRYFQQADQGES